MGRIRQQSGYIDRSHVMAAIIGVESLFSLRNAGGVVWILSF